MVPTNGHVLVAFQAPTSESFWISFVGQANNGNPGTYDLDGVTIDPVGL